MLRSGDKHRSEKLLNPLLKKLRVCVELKNIVHIIVLEISSPCEVNLGISWNKVHSQGLSAWPTPRHFEFRILLILMKHSLYKAQAYSLRSKLFAGGNYMLGCRALAEPICFGGRVPFYLAPTNSEDEKPVTSTTPIQNLSDRSIWETPLLFEPPTRCSKTPTFDKCPEGVLFITFVLFCDYFLSFKHKSSKLSLQVTFSPHFITVESQTSSVLAFGLHPLYPRDLERPMVVPYKKKKANHEVENKNQT